MKEKNAKKPITLSKRSSRTGRLFVLPFYIGFILFFIKPTVETLLFSFGDVEIVAGGFDLTLKGIANYTYLFAEELNYSSNLFKSLGSLLWQTPLIVLISLFIAIILNSNFKGRTFTRAVFFLPVIIVTGTVTLIIQADTAASSVLSGNVVSSGTIEYSSALQDLLIKSGVSSQLVGIFTTVSNAMFNLLWRTGIQMIIFLAGLQGISPSLYEASSIEGATAWENFFKITLPMLSPIILVNLVYTIIDSFTDANNPIMEQITTTASQLKLGTMASMSWLYFLLIAAVLGAVMLVYNRLSPKS